MPDFVEDQGESQTKVKVVGVRGKYPKLTQEQKKEIAKGVDEMECKAAIRAKQYKTKQWVDEKFRGEAKPVWYDNLAT